MRRNLPSLDAAIHHRRPCAKPAKRAPKARTRIKVKRKPAAERAQIAAVRAACVARDGHCRVAHPDPLETSGSFRADVFDRAEVTMECAGPSEWAHLHAKRRSKTVNQAPDVRHTTAHSLMLCKTHHAAYDGHRLDIRARTRKGADGPLVFTRVP